MILRFGSCEYDSVTGRLVRDEQAVYLAPRYRRLLATLAASPGRTVTRQELIEKVWNGQVSDSTINNAVHHLRQKLGGAEGSRLIEGIHSEGYRLNAEPVGTTPDSPSKPAARWRLSGGLGIAAVLLVATAVGLPDGEPRVVSYRLLTDDGLPKRGPLLVCGDTLYFQELTADGYRAMSIPLDGGTPSIVSGLAETEMMDISKTGAVLSVERDGVSEPALYLRPTAKAAPQLISRDLRRAAWSPDGRTVVMGYGTRLAVRRAENAAPIFTAEFPGILDLVRVSPSGDRIRVATADLEGDHRRIWEFQFHNPRPLAVTGERRTISGMTWTADGRYFIYDEMQNYTADLWYIREGKPWLPGHRRTGRLTAGPDRWLYPVASRSANRIFAVGQRARPQLVSRDRRSGRWEPYLGGIPADELDFARDGQWVTYSRLPERTIWISRRDGSGAKQLTDTSMRAEQPHFSPDGRTVAFMGKRSGRPWRIYTVPAIGGRVLEIGKGSAPQGVPTWSSTGDRIAYGEYPSAKPEALMRIHVVEMANGLETALAGSEGLWTARWSPDGRYLLALTRDSRTIKLFDAAAKSWKDLARVNVLDNPCWSKTGEYIYGWATDARGNPEVLRVRVLDGRVETVADLRGFGGADQIWFGLAPDDSLLG